MKFEWCVVEPKNRKHGKICWKKCWSSAGLVSTGTTTEKN